MQNYFENTMTFGEYDRLIDRLVAENKTSGAAQSAELAHYTKLNQYRMNRLEKTTKLDSDLLETVRNAEAHWIWLILTEAWCGDAAQNIPPIDLIARENDGIETRYLLRDENFELMDKYLTNGGRAIPKLICFERETSREIGVWGSRPQAADDYFHELKAQGLEKPEIIEKIQRWYIEDETKSLQAEFKQLIVEWEHK